MLEACVIIKNDLKNPVQEYIENITYIMLNKK